MTKEEIISSGLLELYAMRATSPEEAQLVEEHLNRFPDLKDELKEIESSLENYAIANAIEASPSVKEKLFNQLFEGAENEKKLEAPVIPANTNRKYAVPFFYKSIAAAVSILLIGSMILSYTYFNKYHKAQDALAAVHQQLQQKEISNKAMTHDLDVVTNKYEIPVVLNGTPHAPDAVAKIFWMKNTGDVYIDPTNLPQVPEGKQYQLWGIVDGKPISGGMIQTSKGIYHIQKMKSFGKVEAFAITLENAGGSPTPTMDQMVVIAKM